MHVAIHVLVFVSTSAFADRVSGSLRLNKTFCVRFCTQEVFFVFRNAFRTGEEMKR